MNITALGNVVRAVASALLALMCAQAALGLEPSWKVLRVGLPVYVGSDGADETYATICPSVRSYTNWTIDETKDGCWTSPSGTPAHILAISVSQKLAQATQGVERILLIRSDSGAWQGYASSIIAVQPRVPIGTTLTLDGKVNSGQTSDDGPMLANATQVVVLKFDPHTRDDNVYVRVAAGAHAGAKGWMLYSNVFAGQ